METIVDEGQKIINLMSSRVTSFSGMVGRSLYKIETNEQDQITFYFTDENYVLMHHVQDCCEQVYIESIVGDLNDLVGEPLTLVGKSSENMEKVEDSGTWTFYKFATRKGYVDIRWVGESNGYYSETADISIFPIEN